MQRQPWWRRGWMVGGIVGATALAGWQWGVLADEPKPPVPMKALAPKPLSDEVKKGLDYLVKEQRPDGGWGQGGGWRVSTGNAGKGGRVEGAEVQDPSDVGNTAIATLALVRSGSTPTSGPYATHITKAVAFLQKHIDGADADSLYITPVRDTQLQRKIGQYVDTFSALMVLSELKGKMPDAASEKLLVAALDKTVGKIEKNQQANGNFKGNNGWASVLSQGMCEKGLNRARQMGVKVSEEAIAKGAGRAGDTLNADGTPKAGAVVAAGGRGGDVRTTGTPAAPAGKPADPAAPSDAGVGIYGQSANAAALQEAVNTNRQDEKKARDTLAKPDAKPEEKAKAEETLKRIEKDGKEVERRATAANAALAKQADKPEFVRGFGSNGGEEFLSFMNISETLLVKGGTEWENWDKKMIEGLTKAQDKDGSWSGHHCITGKTFCTATALLVLMADRAPIPTEARAAADDKK